MINKTVAILAGGKSSRMNYNNKAFLSYKESTFIEHIIKTSQNFKEVIIISNNKELYEKYNLKVFSDIYIGNGPLSGIHSAIKNASTEEVLCIACDMPLIKREIIEFISRINENYDVIIPRYNNTMQPLCAIYNKRIEAKIEEMLKTDKNKVQQFILTVNYKVIDGTDRRAFNCNDFININTPEEYKMLKHGNL